MANANFPQGLRPIARDGGFFVGLGILCCVPASVASNIGFGDPVVALGGSDANGVPLVGLASAGAGQPIYGSMLSISNGPAGGGANAIAGIQQNTPVYHQASTLGYILVSNDAAGLYIIQEDSVGGAIAAAVAANAVGNLVAGALNTITGFSAYQLQSSSVTAAANPTYQLKIVGLSRGPGNAVGNYADWVVRINNSQYTGNSGV